MELEGIRIPPRTDYSRIPGLSTEVREKLTAARPATLGQAARVDGVTPAAVSLLLVYLRRAPAGDARGADARVQGAVDGRRIVHRHVGRGVGT